MKENIIQLGKKEGIRFDIVDFEGNKTGEFLEFNVSATDYALKMQEMTENLKKHQIALKNKLTIINKQEDHKGKKMLSSKEEAYARAVDEYYKQTEEDYNMFLGKDGVKKLLNGEPINYLTFKKIDKIIEDVINPELEKNMKSIEDEIKDMFKVDDGTLK